MLSLNFIFQLIFLQTIFATFQLSFKLVSFINDLHYHHSSVFKLVSLTNDLHYLSTVFKRVSYTNVLCYHSKNLCYHSTVFWTTFVMFQLSLNSFFLRTIFVTILPSFKLVTFTIDLHYHSDAILNFLKFSLSFYLSIEILFIERKTYINNWAYNRLIITPILHPPLLNLRTHVQILISNGHRSCRSCYTSDL